MRLKDVDRELLRELLRWEGNQPEGALRFPVRDIARRSGVHPNTVRARLLALQEGGVLEGAFFEPWPRLAGLVHAGWMLSGFRPRDIAARLADYPSVSAAVTGLDWGFLHVWEKDDALAEATARGFAKSVGASRVERHFSSSEFPPTRADELELSALDWRVILALRAKHPASLASIARAAGVTPRMVERRAKRIFEAGGGGMFPRLRPSRIEGAIVAHLLLARGDERGPASLARAFPERVAGPWGRGVNAGVAILVANLEEAERAAARAEGEPGIDEVRVLLYRDVVYNEAFEAHFAQAVSLRHNPRVRAAKSGRGASRTR